MQPITDQPLKVLISFHYWKAHDLDVEASRWPEGTMLFGDSGAFSAYTQGAEIDPDEYAEWIKRWAHRLTVYANLDNLSHPERSLDNQKRLEDVHGLRPLPTFHVGDPWEHLEHFMDGYQYIALGGMVGESPKVLMQWLVACFKRARARDAGHVFHGFGLTREATLANFPWYSVDSSSWAMGQRHGTVWLWNDREHRLERTRLGNPKIMRHAAQFRANGADPELLFDRSKWSVKVRGHLVRHNAACWWRAEQWIRQRHELVECEGRAPGLHLYLADGVPYNFYDLQIDHLANPDLPIPYRDVPRSGQRGDG